MKEYGMDFSSEIPSHEYQQPRRFILAFVVLLFALFLLGLTQVVKKMITPIPSPTPIPYVTAMPLSETPSRSPTPDTELVGYHNPSLSLYFRYPATYGPPQEQEDYVAIISPLNPNLGKIHEIQDGELKMEFVFTDSHPQDSVSAFVADNKSTFSGTVKSEQTVKIAGEDAVEWTWEGVGTGKTYFLIRNNKRIMIMKYPATTTRDTEFRTIMESLSFNPDTAVAPTGYMCPQTKTVDCMPTIGGSGKPWCEPDFLKWASDNCPGFSVAY